MANLITITLPNGSSSVYDLDSFQSGTVTMGRGPLRGDGKTRNMIPVDPDCQMVSRAQASFRREGSAWCVVDENSANGLYCQGQSFKSRVLSAGDLITVGAPDGNNVQILYTVGTQENRKPPVSKGGAPHKNEQSFGSKYSLQNLTRCVIGRAKDCNIIINHPTVSRHHCVIVKEKGQYFIIDNNSTNGVLLNSKSLKRKTLLKPNDRITISGVSFVFRDGHLYSRESIGGATVVANRVCKVVGKKKHAKTIADNISLTIEANSFVAIIGGSGSGKTTLLNCLAGLTKYTSGEVLINNEPISTGGRSLRSLIGYVPQQDIVYDSLSLERMLYYSAKLKMSRDSSEAEIRSKIKETLELVELSAHRDTMISKLSGGERKRASIAVELLASPKLFFLDEPSSGLDPGTEKHLMLLLRKLSRTGRTVVIVTHAVQNLDLCDKIVCMGRGGKLCFYGSAEETRAFFQKQSLTDIYDELNDNPQQLREKFRHFLSRNASERAGLLNVGKTQRVVKGPIAMLREFWILACRYVEILINSRLRLLLLLLMPIALTLLVCAAFQADGGLFNVLLRSGLSIVRENYPFLLAGDTMSLMFAFSCAAFWTGIFNSIQEISKERPIYIRERFSGVSVLPYVMSKFVPQLILCLIQSVTMLSVLMIMTSTTITLNGDVSSSTALKLAMPSDGALLGSGMIWPEVFLTTFLCVLSAMCMGLLISSLVSNELALVLCPVCLMPQILFSGVVGSLTGFTKTISEVISCKWSCLAFFISTNINSLYKSVDYANGWELTSFEDDGIGILDAAYEFSTPYIFGMDGISSAWLVLTSMCVIFVVAAILILQFRKNETR